MDRGAWRAIYSPWGCKELDTTERLCARAHTHTHTRSRVPGSAPHLVPDPLVPKPPGSLLGADPEPCPVERVSGAGPSLLPVSTVTLKQENHCSGFTLKTDLLSDVTDQERTETPLGL